MSSDEVALQADVTHIPSTALGFLGAAQPLLRALSADDVTPMAVLQMEAIGSCFHLNGEYAQKIPDYLKRSKSVRLERIAVSVGWMKGDTASAMAETHGGRAGSLLALILVEMYGSLKAGEILFDLSTRILRTQKNNCSMNQLSRVAEILSNKLGILAFGTHLATQATRIRETYLNSNLPIPSSLVQPVSESTMVDFLVALHAALTEDTSVLHFEGTVGVGFIVAILTALCPVDVSILVEDELIFQGERRSVVVSIKAAGRTAFGIETILVDNRGTGLSSVVSPDPNRTFHSTGLQAKWDGFLAHRLDMAFLQIGCRPTNEIRSACADLIASIATVPVSSGKAKNILPNGVKGLLGPFAHNRIRDCLARTLLAEPSFTLMDTATNYVQLFTQIQQAVSEVESMVCSGCTELYKYRRPTSCECALSQAWVGVGEIIGDGIAALFIKCDPDSTIQLPNQGANIGRRSFVNYLVGFGPFVRVEEGPFMEFGFGQLHSAVLSILNNNFRDECLGFSSASSSLFPNTLLKPIFCDPPYMEYHLMDGHFNDGRNYYRKLTGDDELVSPRMNGSGLVLPASRIIPSSLGVHSGLIMTVRPTHDGLKLRTVVQASGKEIKVSFMDLHLGSMGVQIARGCEHDPRTPLDKVLNRRVVTTSVAAPVTQGKRVAITLTHCSPEAQFLCCVRPARILFQSNSCLNCVFKEAVEGKFTMVIQS